MDIFFLPLWILKRYTCFGKRKVMSQFLRQTFQRVESWMEPALILVNYWLVGCLISQRRGNVEDIDLLSDGYGWWVHAEHCSVTDSRAEGAALGSYLESWPDSLVASFPHFPKNTEIHFCLSLISLQPQRLSQKPRKVDLFPIVFILINNFYPLRVRQIP